MAQAVYTSNHALQIAGMCNYSSSIAFRNGRDEITMIDLISAVEQSKYGRSYDVVRCGTCMIYAYFKYDCPQI